MSTGWLARQSADLRGTTIARRSAHAMAAEVVMPGHHQTLFPPPPPPPPPQPRPLVPRPRIRPPEPARPKPVERAVQRVEREQRDSRDRLSQLLGIERAPYWQRLSPWKNIAEDEFLRYQWQIKNTIQTAPKLYQFLDAVLPDKILPSSQMENIKTKEDFIHDVIEGMSRAPMAVRLTPHTLSVIDWEDALNDPVRKQFIPMRSAFVEDHPHLELDSLHETADSPVSGLVHRYPDKALFLATSVCPVYCRFCTRSYSVGANTENIQKNSFKPTRKRWDDMFEYIAKTPALTDIVVSGGDSYYLQPEHLLHIGERLLGIPHIRRIRFASKGLAVCPARILDPQDTWTRALLTVSRAARSMGKSVALHTHFNHPNEITWVTRMAAQHLYEQSLTVRNQSVLLKGVNDSVETMSSLIRSLADINIQPYYVYQGDMVQGVEDLRTPLSTILRLEREIRGTIAGFMMPQFVVDLPGGGGKRLASTYMSYRHGRSTFTAPAVTGNGKGAKIYEYFDPVGSAVDEAEMREFVR